MKRPKKRHFCILCRSYHEYPPSAIFCDKSDEWRYYLMDEMFCAFTGWELSWEMWARVEIARERISHYRIPCIECGQPMSTGRLDPYQRCRECSRKEEAA